MNILFRDTKFKYMTLVVVVAMMFALLFAASPMFAQETTAGSTDSDPETCSPTEADAMGPFYKPDTPIRSSVGEGYLLTGVVRSSQDCSSIEGAKIEFWLAGPDGRYHDNYRATIVAGELGDYSFESNLPPSYARRPPHIHIRISAKGFKALVTQHYPEAGQTEGEFDLVLIPAS